MQRHGSMNGGDSKLRWTEAFRPSTASAYQIIQNFSLEVPTYMVGGDRWAVDCIVSESFPTEAACLGISHLTKPLHWSGDELQWEFDGWQWILMHCKLSGALQTSKSRGKLLPLLCHVLANLLMLLHSLV